MVPAWRNTTCPHSCSLLGRCVEHWKRIKVGGEPLEALPPSLEPWRPGALLEKSRGGGGGRRTPFARRKASSDGPEGGMPGTLWNSLYRVKRLFHEASGRDAASTDFAAMLVDFQEVVRATRSHAGNAVGAAPTPLRPTDIMHRLCATGSSMAPLVTATGQADATNTLGALDLKDTKPPMAADVQATYAQSTTTCETPARVPAASQSAAPYASAVAQGASLDPACSGAILLAVCRGKAAEGIDFSDDYARTVVGESVRGLLRVLCVKFRTTSDARLHRSGRNPLSRTA